MMLCRHYIRTQLLLRFKHTLDISKVPPLLDKDIEEMHVRGSGPGGQKINKTANCVVMKHIPTGIVVKCQETRELHKNRVIARSLLQTKLDNFVNRENSLEAQTKVRNEKRSLVRDQKREKLQKLKEAWKNQECNSIDQKL
ncbi:mitochondrial translation release factor in rescue [Diabrotica virgifera virgifera]|uniref:Probable peptide chain release factor C12orf65 homolog, mitochondrial n=1 Tax=Diabrotica virgifera virgifera TaxID=50390 RepID=A0A6P7FFU1_DIAVI|nr:mitochondrial translation release factor in rescue [Diabrotica virgifera virgifera]